MENCLVTKLKGSVSNQNIEKLGVLQIVMAQQSGTKRLDIGLSSAAEIKIIGDAVFTDSTGSDNLGQNISIPATGASGTQRFLKNVSSNDILEISNKYAITKWGANTQTELTASEFNYADWLTSLSNLNFGINHGNLHLLDLDMITKYSSDIKSIICINCSNCIGTIETIVENIFGKRTVADNLVMSVYRAKIKLNNTLLTIANSSTNITIAFTSNGATVTLGSTQIAEYDKDNGWTYSN